MTPTEQRDQACKTAKEDAEASLEIAVAIENAWYSCQAIACALRYASNERISEISSMFIERSKACTDAYQQSAVQAWMIGALVERGFLTEAKKTFIEAIEIAKGATPESSKSKSLFLLFQAAFPLGKDQIIPVAGMIRDVAMATPHWRPKRDLVDAMAQLSQVGPAEMEAILAVCDDQRIANRVKKKIADGHIHPRSFFW